MATPNPQVNNDLTTIITAIITSSVLAAALTKASDYFFNRIDYKRDYYKKIIDKRLEAYDILNKSLYVSNGNILNSDSTKYNIIYSSAKDFYLFGGSVQDAANLRIWYSMETANNLMEFINYFSLSSVNAKVSIYTSDEVFHQFGIESFNRFDELKNKLEASIMKDFASLENVPKYLESFKSGK
ncbi:MAG: hypothetical protein JWP37_3325 [Mucilaginibacter sp.]|nr:hypothetical protein [Mucilaginibacter sp.]